MILPRDVLERGEVGVSFFPQGYREILKEAELELIDRSFQPGDLCKRSIDDVRSGVVTHVDVQCKLEHAISGEQVPGWKTMSEICSTLECELGDYVAYNNWIGQVRAILYILPAIICLTQVIRWSRYVISCFGPRGTRN